MGSHGARVCAPLNHGGRSSAAVTLRITSFGFLVGLGLGACVMTPGPAFSRIVQTPNSLTDPLVPGNRIVLLASGASVRDDDATTRCVRDSLARTNPMCASSRPANSETPCAHPDGPSRDRRRMHGTLETTALYTSARSSC